MFTKTNFGHILLALGLMIMTACTGTNSAAPEVTHDGLTRVPKSKFGEVYAKPGVDLTDYAEVGLEPCEVAFKKNWVRDQNSSRVDLSNRVTQEDVDKIKDTLSASCDEEFLKALQESPAYTVAENFSDGEHVLILRPSIINLDINAPDVRTSGMSRSYTTSAGEMTLYLELVDATTGETLARVVDRKRDMDTGQIQWTSSVSNKADAERTLRRWAKLLRDGLDSARDI